MLRIGVIGAGRHGERYIRHLNQGQIRGATLAGFWRRDRALGSKLAAELSAKYEPDLELFLARPEVDAFVVAVPAGEHLAMGERIAAAKKPALLEKPIATRTASARKISDAFADSGVMLTIAQTLRFDPLVVMLKDRIKALGRVRGFTFEQRLEPRGLAWEDQPELSGGGVLIQTGIHAVDVLRFVTGAGKANVLAAMTSRIEYRRNEDQGVMLIRLEDSSQLDQSAIGSVSASKVGRARTVRFAIFLEEVTLEADLIARKLIEVRGRDRVELDVPEEPTIIRITEAFVGAVKGECPNPVPAPDAIRSLAIIEDAYRMAQLTGGSNTTSPSRIL